MPLGMTIMTRAAGPQRLGRVMAVMGVPMLLGPVFGPILGGWLVDDFSWRWIFFINLPIGLFALFLARRVLPRDVPNADHRLDWVGFAPALAQPRGPDLRPRADGARTDPTASRSAAASARRSCSCR